MTDEETRAAAYRAQAVRRAAAIAARIKALAGDPAARRTLGEHWQAIELAQREKRS